MTYTVTYASGRAESYTPPRGTFSTLRLLRREDREKRAREAREGRLVELEKNIKTLEAWHHAWRLEHDADYRALHPRDWCDRHQGLATDCMRYGCWYRQSRASRRPSRDYDITTWSGQVLRRSTVDPSPLTPEERRAATLRMAEWGRQG